jgi:pyruvate/2-oxoglutarate dehydrogenase complex dihydrolipoamide acyltransferase (E2) component
LIQFVPYKTVDVSCLVNVEGGKDLAMTCLRGVDKMSIMDIANYIKEKTSKMKKSGGGEDHKKQTGFAKIMPACVVSIVVEFMSFISNKLGIAVPMLRVESHALGAACVTSLGGLGFVDAFAPFSGFANNSMLLAANAIVDQPVVEDGKVVVGKVMNCNFVVDHRYIDGGNVAGMEDIFRKVFENPEKYLEKIEEKKEE